MKTETDSPMKDKHILIAVDETESSRARSSTWPTSSAAFGFR